MSDAEEELHFLDADAAPTRSETHVSGARVDRSKLFAGFGLVIAAVVVWSVFSSDAAPDPADPQVSESADSESSTVASTVVDDAPAESEAETEPEVEAEIPGRVAAAVPGAEREGVPVLTPSGDLVGSDLLPVEGGPVIPGSELSLMFIDFSGDVEIVDLGTGDRVKHRLVSGELVAQIEDRLLFQDPVAGFVLIVDAAEFGAEEFDGEVLRVESPTEFAVVVAAWPASQGVATVLSTNFAGDSMLIESTIDLETGAVVEERAVDPTLARNSLVSGYALNRNAFSPEGGGVYTTDGEGSYQKVLDGRLLVADDRFALVQNCDESLSCVRQWHDVSTWEALIRPMPEEAFELGLLLGEGRVVVHVAPGEKVLSIFDVELGRDVPIEGSPLGSGIAVSPTGNLVGFVDAETDDVVVIDLDTLERTRLDFSSAQGALAFVELNGS